MDREVIDGFVNSVGSVLTASGRQLRKLQNGYLRSYVLGIGVGVVIILAYLTFRIGS